MDQDIREQREAMSAQREAQAAGHDWFVSALRLFERAGRAFDAVKVAARVEDDAYARAEEDFRYAHEVVNIARQTLRAVRIVCSEGSQLSAVSAWRVV
jgi:hypothetical protein